MRHHIVQSRAPCLVQPNCNVTTYSCRQVYLRFEVEFDTKQESGVLKLAVGTSGTLQELAYRC